MTSTLFLRNMLLSADALQKELDEKTQYPMIFLLAVLRFCKQDYRGFSEIESAEPVLYEEERLRFLLRKVFLRGSTATARMIEYLLKKHRDELAPAISREEMLAKVNELAKLRKYPVMSVEQMLAVVLEHLPPQTNSLLQTTYRNGNISARALMEETEREIYDYVMEEIRKLTERLQQKAKEAKEHRDWRPARVIAPLSEVEEKLSSAIRMEELDGKLQITIPCFFADTGNSLYITVFETEEGFVAHDNKGAIAELSAHLQGGGWQELAQKICAGTICHIEEDHLTVCFTNPHSLLTFLQYVSLVAHADLYPDYDPRGNRYEVNQHYLTLPPKSVTDYSELGAVFRKYLGVSYDEYLGICVGLGVVFLGSNTGSRYVLSTDEQGMVTITDHSNSYNEGAVLENYLNYYEESSQARERIATLAKRFDGICHSDTVSCTFVNDSEDALIRALHRFVQMSVILSQVGYYIPLDLQQTESGLHRD